MFIDICNSNEEADWAVQYHSQLGHANIQKIPVTSGQIAVSTVESDAATMFKLVGKHFEMGGQVWVVTAG